ncbi:MAG TPA: UvrB/UvrC motif-containing protein [Candidatus Acidoferrales bacterium]|nr:UvrB/UvrC motif-containing protein [Candidatus Acidoferrales bacterium]
MLPLDVTQEFDPACETDFFATLPSHPGVLLVEMKAEGAQPYLVRTADIRRAAERLLRIHEEPTRRISLRDVAARVRYRVTGSKFEQALTLYGQAREHFPQRYRTLMRLRPPAVLKVNLRNEYPRCYVTRSIRADGGFYVGPFASRRIADSFAEGFLDLFKIRRCQIKIRRDPGFPGCIYSEMKMCLAPCFAGCSKEEYDAEVTRVVDALATAGDSLNEQLETEREAASAELDFERAAGLHKRIEKVSLQMRALPEIARPIDRLNAVVLQRTAEDKTIAVFPILRGLLKEPFFLRFAELASDPRSVESILRQALDPNSEPREQGALSASKEAGESQPSAAPLTTPSKQALGLRSLPPELPEHLSLIARWFYSKPREGEIFFRGTDWPYRRVLRACGRLLAPPTAEASDAAQAETGKPEHPPTNG